MLHALGRHPNLLVIQDALTSPLFMAYNPSTGSYEQSSAYLGLAKLIDEVRRYNDAATSERFLSFTNTRPSASAVRLTSTYPY